MLAGAADRTPSGQAVLQQSSAELEQARKDAADMLSAAQKDISLLKEKATTEAENLKKDRLLAKEIPPDESRDRD